VTLDANDFMGLVNAGKIDSRMKTPTQTDPLMLAEITYCAICGKKKGKVSQESSQHIKASSIIVICDDCHSQFGELPLEKAPIEEL